MCASSSSLETGTRACCADVLGEPITRVMSRRREAVHHRFFIILDGVYHNPTQDRNFRASLVRAPSIPRSLVEAKREPETSLTTTGAGCRVFDRTRGYTVTADVGHHRFVFQILQNNMLIRLIIVADISGAIIGS